MQEGDRYSSRAGSTASRLRRMASLTGWPSQSAQEEVGRLGAATQGDEKKLVTTGRSSSRTSLRRIASTSGRIFRTNTNTDSTCNRETVDEETMSEDSLKGTSKRMRPAVVRLRLMASLPGRSIKRMTSQSTSLSQDAKPSEGTYLSRMRSWSGSVRGGSSRWFKSNRKETSTSRVVEFGASSEDLRPVRHVHFATAELRPDIGSDSSDDDDLSSYHVSLLPSRRNFEEIRDGGDRQEKWWRTDAYYAALAIPIF